MEEDPAYVFHCFGINQFFEGRGSCMCIVLIHSYNETYKNNEKDTSIQINLVFHSQAYLCA